MKHIIVLFFAFCVVGAFGQVHKRYLDRNLRLVKDSTKAFAYELYQRTADSSEWSVVALTKKDNVPIFKGYYLDEDITVAHGKFVYYQPVVSQQKVGEHQSTVDTLLRVFETGYYNNGHKEGPWVTYHPNGKIEWLNNFEDDTLNGSSERFNDRGAIMLRGNMDHGLKVGDWYTFKTDSSILEHSLFVNGKLVKHEIFGDKTPFYGSYCTYDFYGYLGKYLKANGFAPTHGRIMITATLGVNGQFSNLKLLIGINKALDEALMQAIEASPKWMPALQDDVPVTQQLTFLLQYTAVGIKF